MTKAQLSECGKIVRQFDKDRYLCSLFAPAEKREQLFALYAFNCEVAKISSIVSEAMAGMIRLQWWREAIDELFQGKQPRGHEVVIALYDVLQTTTLTKEYFDKIIDARENELYSESFETLDNLVSYCRDTAGALNCLAAEILLGDIADNKEQLQALGEAYGLVDLLRSTRVISSQQRVYFPVRLMKQYDLTFDDIMQGKNLERSKPMVRELLQHVELKMQSIAEPLPKAFRVVQSQLCIIQHLLKQIQKKNCDIFYSEYSTKSVMLLIKLYFYH